MGFFLVLVFWQLSTFPSKKQKLFLNMDIKLLKDFTDAPPKLPTGTIFDLLLLNGVLVYPLSTMTLLRVDCLTPIQLSVRSECYLLRSSQT